MIPYGRQEIDQDDIDSVVNVLSSEFITQGPTVPKFEESLCKYTGATYGVAVNSCTSALHIACLALGLKSGDILWTSPITFIASANCAIYCGASVDFVDIEPDTALMSVKRLKDKLKLAEQEGVLPKIVIPVHLAGQSCDMKEIHALGKEYGFRIIEDAAHSIGSSYKGLPVGNCRYSDVTVFSFHPVKVITTGEGGVAMTNNPKIHRKMALLRSHGVVRNSEEMTNTPDGPWYYEPIELGFNYRITDFQAALGISQLNKVTNYVSRRREIAYWYNDSLKDIPVGRLVERSDRNSSYHLYIIRVNSEKREQIFNYLRESGIGVNVHYIPLYKFHSFSASDNCEEADRYYKECISIPIYPSLDKNEMSYVVKKIKSIVYE